MSTWNYRGLGNGPAVHGLNLTKEENPDILFLSQTNLDQRRIEGLGWKLSMTYLVVKVCKGKKWRPSCFWKKEINFQFRDVSRFYFDGDVTEHDGCDWRFTGFYGEPRTD